MTNFRKTHLFFCTVLILSLAACKPQDNHPKRKIIKHHHNKVDEIRSTREIDSILFGIDSSRFYDFHVAVKAQFNDPICQRLCDSFRLKSWIREDFDNNGYTDLFCMGDLKSYSRSLCIMDSGDNRFYLIWITKDFNSKCLFPVVHYIDECPGLIVNYKTNSERDFTRHKEDKADTLIFKFGDFIEYHKVPAEHIIERVEFAASGCWISCPEYKIIVNSNGMALYVALRNIKEIGSFEAAIDEKKCDELFSLLNYIDFASLDEHYQIDASDMQSSTLIINYDGGKIKRIYDYGLRGTYGLRRVNNIFYKLKEDQAWKRR